MFNGQSIQPAQLKQFLQNVLVRIQDNPKVANDHPLITTLETKINSL
jgi:hypothetical protein